jgi:hypothetical protein
MWSDADSGVVTDMTSDFESITSSNYAFREEGGRRYSFPLRWKGAFGMDADDGRFHSVEDAPYSLPNDEDEVERLQDLQHCIKLFFGKNILPLIAPNPSLIGNSQIPITCLFCSIASVQLEFLLCFIGVQISFR